MNLVPRTGVATSPEGACWAPIQVHAVVEAYARPEKVMNEFKSYASRELNRLGRDGPDRKRRHAWWKLLMVMEGRGRSASAPIRRRGAGRTHDSLRKRCESVRSLAVAARNETMTAHLNQRCSFTVSSASTSLKAFAITFFGFSGRITLISSLSGCSATAW